MPLDAADHRRLERLLQRAQRAGDLGPGPVTRHIEHAEALAACLASPPHSFLDLGSGAGVPGLVWALHWPHARAVLLEAATSRASRLEDAVEALGLPHCQVVAARAEEAAHRPQLRSSFDVVVARSFEGGPAVTVECGAGFLGEGGRLVVSEPPGGDSADRWPPDRLEILGLGPAEVCPEATVRAVVLERVHPVADRFPRRTGIPKKRPLW